MSIFVFELFFTFVAVFRGSRLQLAAHDDPHYREVQLLPNLRYAPADSIRLWSDESDSIFSCGELFLSHPIVSLMLKVSNSAVIDEINVDWFLILIDTIYYES